MRPSRAIRMWWSARVASMLRAPRVARCVVLFGVLGVFQASLGPLIPVLAARHHLDAATAGLVISVFFVGSLASTVLASLAGERRPDGRVLALLSGVIAAGDLGLVLLPTWPGQLAAVGVAGLGFGALTLLINADLASRPEHGTALVNLVNAAFGIGAALGPALVGATLQQRYSPVLLGVALALLATAAVSGRTAAAPTASTPEPPTTPAPPAREASTGQLGLFCLLLFAYPVLETGLSSWQPSYLHHLGHPTATAAMLTSLFWGGLAASRLVIPLLATRRSPSSLIRTGLALTLVALGLISLPSLASAGFLLAGLASGPIKPSALAWIATHTPHPRRMDGLAMASAMLGNITLPAALGYTMTATSPRTLPALVALATGASLTITLILHRTLAPDRPAGKET